jgi:phenylalanyl-tRNA synthetase alpha subunit
VKIKSAPHEQSPRLGRCSTPPKQKIESALERVRGALADEKLTAPPCEEAARSSTLPGRGRGRGGVHPVIRTWQRIEEIWRSIGFERRRRAGDRDRLVQLHGAQQPGEPSGALDAGHVLLST